YYKAISSVAENTYEIKTVLRAAMLQEMNAIISMNRDQLDLSGINEALIVPIDVDLRITVETNSYYYNNSLIVGESGGSSKGMLCESRLSEYQVKNAEKGKYRITVF